MKPLPQDAIKVTDKTSGAVAYLYDTGSRYGAVCFRGNAQNPDHDKLFFRDTFRDAFVRNYFTARAA